jgi:hypothetical protein
MPTSNSSQYAYYSFPPTPDRKASPVTSRGSSSRTTSTNKTTTRNSDNMAPSPAAGRQQASAPKTPTKLGRKPGNTPQKLGQSAAKGAQSAKSTPKPKAPDASEASEKAGKAQDSAKDAGEEAQKNVELKDDENDDDEGEGLMSKVSQAGEQGKEGLEEAAPEPVQDDDDEEDNDAVEGATQQAEDAADDAQEEGEDVADDATEKAGQAGESADETQDDTEEQDGQEGGQLLSGAKGLAGKAKGLAGKQDPKKAAQDPKQAAEDVKDDAEETAEGAAEEGQKVAGETTDEAGEAAEDAKDTAEDTAEDAQDEAEDATEDAQDQVEDGAEDAQDQAEGATEDAEDQAEGATEGAEDQVNGVKDEADDDAEDAEDQDEDAAEGSSSLGDLSVLKGLEVGSDGNVNDSEGNPIGTLAEGDAEDLEGYPIGDNGEILDDDGDLVGRCELLPAEIKRQIQEARENGEELPEGAEEYLDDEEENDEEQDDDDEEDEEDDNNLPGLSIMEGLTCQVDGLIYDSEGNTIGKVTEGDPAELQNATLNAKGEFIDEEGNVVGYADIHEDAADLVEQGIYEPASASQDAAEGVAEDAEGEADEAGEQADQANDAADRAEDAADAAEDAAGDAEEQAEGIEDELPGIEALEGKELNEAGEIIGSDGGVLGHIEDEEIRQKIADGEIDPDTLNINEEGQVVDEDGNILSATELAEGAAEKLGGGLAKQYDIRILEGRKVNKKGKVLDDDGEEIGQLVEGDVAKCAGQKINEKGEVKNKKGETIGKVGITEGEAAETATHDLLEELGELPEDDNTPGIETLEGYKLNKKGKVLNEDGEEVGELAEGELAKCAGKKINDKGEILDKDGKTVLGKVRVLPQSPEEEEEVPEEEQEGELEEGEGEEGEGEAEEEEGEGEEEEEGNGLPPLSILDGLPVNKAGKLLDSNGNIVGELVEGDAKKLSKSGLTSDAEGQFWDNKGKVIGRAQTVPQEDGEDEAPFAGLEGLKVIEGGYVADENGNVVGVVTEGDAKKLIGRSVDEDGDIIDKKGSVVGHADRYEEDEVPEEEAADLSFLKGKEVNKAGVVIGDEGTPIARLVEGNPKSVAGRKLDDQGQLWNDQGEVIGRVELIPEHERESKPEGPFAGLEGLRVVEDGKVADENDNLVGEIVEGNPKRLIGLAVDEDGDIVDKYGNVKGHAEPLPEEEEEAPVDNSILENKELNKQGYVVDEKGIPFGRLVEGNVKELAGRRCDENGYIYGDTGKVVGRCEVLPENERVSRPEGPFAGHEGLRVVKDGKVEDQDGNVVGEIVEGNAKKLVGLAVDEDGDIIDKYGNVKGHADPWEEEEEQQVDNSALAGTTINKTGNAVDSSGKIIGRVTEGDVATLVGKKVDGEGQIWDNAGNIVGRCELVFGEDTSPEGPFAGFEGLEINKDGTITTQGGDIIGRVTEGDIKKLLGHGVEEDGTIIDKNGNQIGAAERWEPEEKERRVNPMSGMRVNKEGEVRDENGDLVGRLTDGALGHCVGQEIDDNGNVVDQDGNKIGECTLLENINEEEYEGPTEEELAEAAKREEEREIAQKMNTICQQTLERVQPICKQIKEHMDKADRTPKEELDEEELVNNVKPLIEEAGRHLQECNGSLRGLDPDGKIAAQAKGRQGTGEATPEEHALAESLKELTTTVVTTIDDAKKKLNDMPHAKKKLNPLWGLMTQPLFQILAAVGLLLAGVLGLVGQLLNGLGLGGLVNGLLGGLGVNKLLGAFGLGGDDKKKGKDSGKSKLSSLPIVGGMLGGDKK